MSETLVYCSDDRRFVAQLKRHYQLKPLLLYERGLYGSAAHLPLHAQKRLLIALDGRGGGGGGSSSTASATTLAYSAELSAVLLGTRTIGGGDALMVAVVARAAVAVATEGAPAAAAADAPAVAKTTGLWAVAKRVHIEHGGAQQSKTAVQHPHRTSYYFDLIDIPPRFALCDVIIPATEDATDTSTQSIAAAASVPLAPLYAPLYRLFAQYLAPHQILTVIAQATANRAATNSAAAAPAAPLSEACQLAERYLALQQRAEYQRDGATHQQIMEHCMTHHRLSQFQAAELRQRLQRHPQIDPTTVTALLDCRSYADITATLS